MTGPRWTTPRKLRAAIGATWAMAGLLFLIALSGLAGDRAALRAIAKDSAPSIVASEELAAQLADLDAQLADSLLGSTSNRDVAGELFELRRSSANRRLVDSADNITYGDAERIPIVVLSEELGRYLELAARAQSLYVADDRDGAVVLLRLATNLMHARILPAASALDAVNRDHMDAQYARAQHDSTVYEGQALVAGMILVLVLLLAQIYLARHTRRRLAPLLAIATLLAVVFTSYLVGRFRDGREALREARDDAFNSVHLLWRARALAYDANGDEIRWLLDRSRAGDLEMQYRQKVSQLVSRPTAAVARTDLRSGAITGLLVDEANNVTYAGEREAASATLDALFLLSAADDRLRRLEREGKHGQAVELSVGSAPDGPTALFDRFDAAVERTIAINQHAFDGATAAADQELRRAEWLDPAFALAIALLGWLGVRPRLREYAG